jgi:hypothetical protein
MPGHSRSKNGVLKDAYVPGIHALFYGAKGVDGRDKPGHDRFCTVDTGGKPRSGASVACQS